MGEIGGMRAMGVRAVVAVAALCVAACEGSDGQSPVAIPDARTAGEQPQRPVGGEYYAGAYGQCFGSAQNGRFFKELTEDTLCMMEGVGDLCLDEDPLSGFDHVAVSVERCRELCGDDRVNYCNVNVPLSRYTAVYGRRHEPPDGGVPPSAPGLCPFMEEIRPELERDPYRLECMIYVDIVGERYRCEYGNPSSSVASCRTGWRP